MPQNAMSTQQINNVSSIGQVAMLDSAHDQGALNALQDAALFGQQTQSNNNNQIEEK